MLAKEFPNDFIVAEENASLLQEDASSLLLERITHLANSVLPESRSQSQVLPSYHLIISSTCFI